MVPRALVELAGAHSAGAHSAGAHSADAHSADAHSADACLAVFDHGRLKYGCHVVILSWEAGKRAPTRIHEIPLFDHAVFSAGFIRADAGLGIWPGGEIIIGNPYSSQMFVLPWRPDAPVPIGPARAFESNHKKLMVTPLVVAVAANRVLVLDDAVNIYVFR